MQYLILFIPIIFFSIIYQGYRKYVVETAVFKDKGPDFYSSKTILSKFLLSLFVLFLVYAYSFFIIYDLQINFNVYVGMLFILFVIFFSFSFGLYIGMTIIEQFILNNLKKCEDYKTLKFAIKQLHGPLSHVLMYFAVFIFFILLEFGFAKEFRFFPLLIIFGLFLGIGLFYAQIINHTFKHQAYPFLFYFFVNTLLILFDFIKVNELSIIFEIALFVSATCLMVTKYYKKGYYLYDKYNYD